MQIIFLDRDGVINRFPGKGRYVTRSRELKVFPQALKGIRLLTEAGYRLAVVSNQGSVSRGLLSKKDLDLMTRQMLHKIRAKGGKIHKVYYCIHQTSDQCECKKPKTALYKKALKGSRVDLNKVFVIGDSVEDISAGHALGCQTILVLTGRNQRKDVKFFPLKPHFVKKNLLEAAQWLLKKRS